MSAKRVILTLVAMCLMAGTATAATLKIGSLSPLTGSYAADGNDIANGARAAIAAIEKEGGIPGFDKIELFAEDDACDPRQAVAAANKLVNEKVVGVVGAYCSSATIPASETLAEADIPMLTPASTSEKVTERGLPYMFRVCGRDDDQSIAAMKFIKDMLAAKTIYIVDDKTTYSQGLADNVEKLANKEGLKVIAHDHVNQGDKDFSAVLTKIKDAKPDVLYMSLQNSASGALMLIQAKRAGVTAAIIGQDAVYHPQLMEIAKDAAEGMYLTFGYIDEETPSYKKFLAAYEKFGKPGAYSAYSYDAAYSLLSAIKAAKSTDPAKIKAELIKGEMQGASKKIKFQANGESGSNYIIRVVKDGKFANFWDPQTGKKY
ncbi:branched-chain amino acid ABC transporter substrate-binding protein [Solidesulfovibrio magneticus]|uniref:Branched-chain amino acid ABC transporter substrate binding protein n=1 Tax=Solidesulfovibrio magneticus (strain ATCC 700980 / DSM 13731 / RS-1) TaxID=573370 RepID=C4XRY5_SOLM1|nr:branched-chain amino acid ABC transporter substrate-binding protein [Solidesulfovibrio magneticus]BAH78051.1 branched-chain amino acid ABC transporter substrate binding protein precursor [Solidesulfovibrio magneticus RS-1]